MKRFLFPLAVSVLFLCGTVHAGLEGDYELLSGPGNCPVGSLQTLAIKDNPGRVILFGARHSWALAMADASGSTEVVPGGCTYASTYEKTENRFVNRTTRSKCPSKSEEGVVTEKMTLRDKTLVYEFAFRKMNFKCRYRKND